MIIVRLLTTATRKKIEAIITKLGSGEEISLKDRIKLRKYSIYIPFIANKVKYALRQRERLEKEGLI